MSFIPAIFLTPHHGVVPDEEFNAKCNEQIDNTQQQFQDDDARKMLGQQLRVPCDVAVVEIGDAHVEHHVEKVGEVEDGEIETVGCGAHAVLHRHINSQNPERLHQQVQENEDGNIENKVSLFHRILCNALMQNVLW